VLGKNVATLLYEKPESYQGALIAVLRQGEWSGEATQKTQSGRGVLIETRWSLLRDTLGRPKSILSINTDITAKKQLETQFFRAQRMENVGTLAGGIAHDLNNVLAPIILAIDLLKLRVHDAYSQELLGLMDASSQRGVAMVKQVLSFARGVEGKRVPLSACRLVQELDKIVRDTFPKSIAIEAEVALHENAQAGAHVLFEVSDTGSGMAPEVVEQIFEPFFTTKDVGKGTTFRVSLPAAPGSETAGEALMMPVMDGAATIRVLMRINPKVRIITTSGLSAKAIEADAAAQGVKHFLSKPYSAEVFLQSLRTVLAAP
jgi:signal transduction histidine kinase